jgi:hypothetical protein
MTAIGVINIINLLMRALVAGKEVATVIRAGRDALTQMVDEGRDPTPAELDALFLRVEDRQRRIREAMGVDNN